MFRKILLCALASAAMIPAAAVAQRGGGGGGGMGHGGGAGGMGNGGGVGMGGGVGLGNGGFGSSGVGNGTLGNNNGLGNANANVGGMNQARMNSQGPANASATGIAHANSNSVLAGTTPVTTISTGAFAGLTTGTMLYSNGTAVGTVQQIRTNARGQVVLVVVKGTNGGMYAVPASKLTFSGGTLSTSARLAGINTSTTITASTSTNMMGRRRLNSQGPLHASATGITHANFHSVLARGTVVSGSLAGLTTGLSVRTSGGMTLGTVSRIVTDSSGNVRLVIVTSPTGQTFRLMPTSLTLSGGVVTTTSSTLMASRH